MKNEGFSKEDAYSLVQRLAIIHRLGCRREENIYPSNIDNDMLYIVLWSIIGEEKVSVALSLRAEDFTNKNRVIKGIMAAVSEIESMISSRQNNLLLDFEYGKEKENSRSTSR